MNIESNATARSVEEVNATTKALGRLSKEFSFMEIMIATAIWGLPKDPTAMILTAHLSFSRLCQSTDAIGKEKLKAAPHSVEQLRKIMERAMHLEGERNRLIHSWWTTYPGDTTGVLSRIKVTARGRLEIQFEPNVSPDDLNAVADEIKETAKELVHFLMQNSLLLEPVAKSPTAN